MTKPPTRFAMFHCGPEGCGQVAFYLVDMPIEGQQIRACDVRVLEGMVEPMDNQPIACGSCGVWMTQANLQVGYVAEVQ